MDPGAALEDRKGISIKLIGGTATKHPNLEGAWLDTGRVPTTNYYYIIVEKQDPEDPTRTYLDSYRALKVNCVEPDPAPKTYIEAAFQQVPQLSHRLTSFAKMAAKCRVPRGRELSNVVKEYLERETRNLLLKGPNAEYRLIDTSELPNVVPDVDPTAMDPNL